MLVRLTGIDVGPNVDKLLFSGTDSPARLVIDVSAEERKSYELCGIYELTLRRVPDASPSCPSV